MGRQVERHGVSAKAPSTPWLACHQPHGGGGGEAAWRGEEYCELADPVDHAWGGGPPPPLRVGGGGGRSHGGVIPLSTGGERELGPHTSGVRSELRGLGVN
jgi:hypothetical protein